MCTQSKDCFGYSVFAFGVLSTGLICTMTLWYLPNVQLLNTLGQGMSYVQSQSLQVGWCGQYQCCFASVNICAPGFTTNCMDTFVNTFDTCAHAQEYLNAWLWVGAGWNWCFYYKNSGIMIPPPDTTSPVILAVFIGIAAVISGGVLLYQLIGCIRMCCKRRGYQHLHADVKTMVVAPNVNAIN